MMRGYHVVTGDGRRIGRVVGMRGDFLIVEVGRVLRSRRPVPIAFAHPNDAERKVSVTVPRASLWGSPKVNGRLDERAAAAHYGLAASAFR